MTALQPIAVWATLAGVLGLAIGSFLNVVICRVPAGVSVLRPASRCPSCDVAIRTRHNVPVVGWFVLRGRCADCASPISARYPVVEAATAALFVLITVRLGQLHLGAAVPAYLYLGAAGLALAIIDVDHRRLPNAIVLPSYPIVAMLLLVASASTHDWWALGRAGIGAGALFAFYVTTAVVSPGGMGFGDVKLAGLLGGLLGYLSWTALVIGAFAGFLIGATVGVVLLVRGGDRKTAIPFGPSMLAGALLMVWLAAPVADLYARSRVLG